MLNQNLNLNPDIFSNDIKQAATRDGFGEGLVQAGRDNPHIVALCADVTESTRVENFAKEFPNRFIEMGIQEQSMASVASGLAKMGKIPFMASYCVFSPGRNWEQIRTTICYNNSNVKIVGSHAGVSVGPDGGSHQALEDIALMRTLPNIKVISPCDSVEAKKAVAHASKEKGPIYIRLAREKSPIITTENTPFKIGRSEVLFGSKNKEIKIGFIATGPLLYNTLLAAHKLDSENIGVKVMNISTIKPLSEKWIVNFAKDLKGIVTVEEHQIACGLGGAIAELLSATEPKKIAFIGVDDKFGQSGKSYELIKHYRLGTNSILNAARGLLA